MGYLILGIIMGIYFIGEAYDIKITKNQSIYIDDTEYKCVKTTVNK